MNYSSFFRLAAYTGAVFLALSASNAWAQKGQPQYTENGTQACLVCHSGELMQAIQNGAHSAHDSLMTPMSDGQKGCESCHGPGSFHVSRAHGGKGFPNLIKFGRGEEVAPRDVQLESCLSCHRDSHGDIQATPFIGSLHDKRSINCSTCHSLHVVEDPILHQKEVQDETCYRCHRKMKTEHNPFEGKSIDLARLTCGTCHDVHAVKQD